MSSKRPLRTSGEVRCVQCERTQLVAPSLGGLYRDELETVGWTFCDGWSQDKRTRRDEHTVWLCPFCGRGRKPN
jgi:hypothetical protein